MIRRKIVWLVEPAPEIKAVFTQGMVEAMAAGMTATATAMMMKNNKMIIVVSVERVPSNSAIAVMGATSPMAP